MAGQVESAEACLRLSGLMNQLSLSEQDREAYIAIDKMAASIAHIPIMQGWKELPKKERRLYEVQIASKQILQHLQNACTQNINLNLT